MSHRVHPNLLRMRAAFLFNELGRQDALALAEDLANLCFEDLGVGTQTDAAVCGTPASLKAYFNKYFDDWEEAQDSQRAKDAVRRAVTARELEEGA